MIKRDAGQDGDRAHFYSQYWIDIAQGKPTRPSGGRYRACPWRMTT